MNTSRNQMKNNNINYQGVVKISVIKDYMRQKGLNEEDFAKKCKIELRDLKKVLSNVSAFEPICLLRIARTMGVEFSDLVND